MPNCDYWLIGRAQNGYPLKADQSHFDLCLVNRDRTVNCVRQNVESVLLKIQARTDLASVPFIILLNRTSNEAINRLLSAR